MKYLTYASSVLLLCVTTQNASGSLIYDSSVPTSGIKLGKLPTVLTIGNQNGSSTVSGCVGWGGTDNVIGSAGCPAGFVGGDESTGASQTTTRTLIEIGVTSAADLRIVFDPNEPGGDSITLANLVLTIFSSGGTPLFTSGPFATALVFPNTHGTVFLFRLHPDDVTGAASAFTDLSNRIGLAASLTDAAGGFETFHAMAVASGPPPQEIPEPASAFLILSGLLAAAILLRRR